MLIMREKEMGHGNKLEKSTRLPTESALSIWYMDSPRTLTYPSFFASNRNDFRFSAWDFEQTNALGLRLRSFQL